MQDRFKFRVWDKANECWVDNECCSIYGDGTISIVGTNQYGEDCFCETDNCIIEQCTGLKDKNGKPIYDGDILQDCEQKIKVVFDEERHCFMFEYQYTHAYKPISCIDVLDGDFEIIGNIHENVDLLNDNK